MTLTSAVLLALLFAPQNKPPEKCTISGTVVNVVTGAPLNKVELRAEPLSGHDPVAASTTTDAAGNFTLIDLPAGQYKLKGVRNGFLDTYYGARRAGSSGTVLNLEAGQEIKDLQVKLLPFGVIAGVIRDADGELVAGAGIRLLRQRYDETGRRKIEVDAENVRTDDLGQYRIANLEPGTYYVQAKPRNGGLEYGYETPVDHSPKSAAPPTATLPTLYPGVLDSRGAQTVEVAAGARVTGIDITLVRSRVFRVLGHASVPLGMELVFVELYSAPFVENLSLGILPTTNREGDFELNGVPPNSYMLHVSAQPVGEPKQPGVFTIDTYRRDYRARIPLTVGGDMDGVTIALTPGTEVTGHVTIEGTSKAKVAGAAIHFAIGGSEGQRALIREDNTFATGLYADHYNLYLDRTNVPLIVKSIRSDGIDVYQEGLTVPDSGKVTLEIVLAPEGAQTAGVVLDKDDKPAAGATVMLIAEPKLRSRYDSFEASTTDQNGRYHFDNIRPGDYKVFAWDDVEPNVWFDPEFLKTFESKGEPTTIPVNGRVTSSVHLISAGK